MGELVALHAPFIPKSTVPQLFPSISRVAEVSCPFLIIHGDKDALIPVDHAHELHQAATNTSARLEIIAGADHNNVEYVGGKDYYEMIARFLRETEEA